MGLIYIKPKEITPIYTLSPLKNKVKKKKVILPKQKDSSLFKTYKKKVWKLTEVNCQFLENITERGFTNYHVEHMISISYGFRNNIPIENIAHLSNLRMLFYKDNMIKGVKCFVNEQNQWILHTSK